MDEPAATTTDPTDTPSVVVGVDGSAASRQALLFAAGEAQLRSALLRIVAAYDVSRVMYGYAAGLSAGWDLGPTEERLREAAEALVKDAADTVATDVPGTPVHVQTIVARGRPSHVLLHAADSAALLVVGARGAGALTRLMLGSTSSEVVHDATVPVTVVPSSDRGAQPAVRA
jgi:nucleotide-binding universal stress UspA family protein